MWLAAVKTTLNMFSQVHMTYWWDLSIPKPSPSRIESKIGQRWLNLRKFLILVHPPQMRQITIPFMDDSDMALFWCTESSSFLQTNNYRELFCSRESDLLHFFGRFFEPKWIFFLRISHLYPKQNWVIGEQRQEREPNCKTRSFLCKTSWM